MSTFNLSSRAAANFCLCLSGWVPNTDLEELDPETVASAKMDKMRKDLQAAHDLASENHPLDHYKGVLQQFQEDMIQQQKAKEAKAVTPTKKKKTAKAEAEEEDVEMAGAADNDDESEVKEKKLKKRKAEESAEVSPKLDVTDTPSSQLTLSDTTEIRFGKEAKD
jgi:hypothetical protein